MKKIIVIIVTVLVIAALLAVSLPLIIHAAQKASGLDPVTIERNVTAEAGLNALADGYQVNSRYDYFSGSYAVTVTAAGETYEYEVDPSGKIVSKTTVITTSDGETPKVTISVLLEDAKDIALQHAGLAANTAVRFLKADLDRDNGRVVWDIEFVTDRALYEYEIDAKNGKIVDYEQDAYIPGTTAVPDTTDTAARENVKAIVLADAGFAEADVTFTECHQDLDDNLVVWDIEFIAGNQKYEYEVDAITGKILEKKVKPLGNTSQKLPTDNAALADAQAKALADAGLTEAEVTFTEAKADYDDGVLVYEIEFFTATHQYEYEIDAATLAIRDKSVKLRASQSLPQDPAASYITPAASLPAP